MARAASPQITQHPNPLMSRNPKQGPPYRHPRQEPHHVPFQEPHQPPSAQPPNRSTGLVHQSTPIDPSALSPRVPDQAPSSFPPVLFDVFSSQRTPSQSAPPPTHSNLPPYRPPPHPSLTVSAPQRPNPLSNIYHQPSEASGPEVPVMWPPDQQRYEPQPGRSQPRAGRSILETPPPIPDFGQHQVPFDESTRDRRESRFYTPHEQTVATTAGYSAEGSSTDTRRGKDRVQRPCTKCGTMNHIRKKECSNCKEPKEPPKKRVKRSKRKKNPLPQGGSSHHTPLTHPLRPSEGQTGGHPQILSSRSDLPGRGHDPREEMLQSMLDPNTNLMIPMAPVLPTTSGEEQLPHSAGYPQRSSAFSAPQTFEGGYRNFQQP